MKKRIISLFLVVLLMAVLFTGCDKGTSGGTEGSEERVEAVVPDFAADESDMFSDRDYEVGYTEENAVYVTLTGDTATATSDSVRIDGGCVTLTGDATYVISGSLTDGQIVVDAEETAKPQLVLNGVNVHSSTSAALYVLECDKVFVTLAKDSENVLSSGDSFVAIDDNNIDGALYSKQDITLNGEGSLTVTSPAGHGIVAKDDLVLTGGVYAVTSAFHGLDANDSVRIANASLTVDAGKDGIHAENSEDASLGFVYLSSGTYQLEAEGDGISAGAYLQVEGGSFDILAGGGSVNGSSASSGSYGGFGGMAGSSSAATDSDSTSMKGLKAASGILITDGVFRIDSADDGVHANASVTVNGGSFDIATGDDGFHADETLTVTAGSIHVTESYEGFEGLDIVISGGDIRLVADDDGINAAGGTDSSGMGGFRGDDMFGGGMGGGGRPRSGVSGSSSGSILISGGNIYINASGDGIDANGTLEISGGYTVVCGPTQGDTATLDYDSSGIITGGTFIGTGASGMAQSFSDSEQGVFAVSIQGSMSAGTEIVLTDAEGNVILSYTPELSFSVIILSSPDIEKGESYTVTAGEISGTFEAS